MKLFLELIDNFKYYVITKRILLFVLFLLSLLLLQEGIQGFFILLSIVGVFWYLFIKPIKNKLKQDKIIVLIISIPVFIIILLSFIYFTYIQIDESIRDYKEEQQSKRNLEKQKEEIAFQNELIKFTYKKLSFKVPRYLTFGKNDNIKLNNNIRIEKKTWDELFDSCSQNALNFLDSDISSKEKDNILEERRQYNNLLLNDLINGKESSDKFYGYDHQSCGMTVGILSGNIIKIGNYNAFLSYNYSTQDEELGCLSSIFTSLLIPINKEEVYSVTFNHNFGRTKNFLSKYPEQYGERCIYNSSPEDAKAYSKELTDYYRFGKDISNYELYSFRDDEETFQNIINTMNISK